MKKLLFLALMFFPSCPVHSMTYTNERTNDDYLLRSNYGIPSNTQPPSPRMPISFFDKFATDTKEVAGKSFKTQVYIDCTGQPARFGASSTIIAWRFLGLEPALTYTPDAANKPTEFEIIVPIRLSRIPIGHFFELRDFFYEIRKIDGWFDHLHLEPYLSQNLSTGHFTFGFAAGLEFK